MKKIPVTHLHCTMIEQNNSLGTNAPLPFFEMALVVLSGLWAWFEKGAVQQILYSFADLVMY